MKFSMEEKQKGMYWVFIWRIQLILSYNFLISRFLSHSILGLLKNVPATSWKYLHSNQIISELLKSWGRSWLLPLFFEVPRILNFFYWLLCTACEILVSWPGIKPMPSAVKAWSPIHWTAREFPNCFSLIKIGGVLNVHILTIDAFHTKEIMTPDSCASQKIVKRFNF